MTRDPQRAKVYAAEEFVRTLFDRTAEHGDPGVDFFGTGPRSAAISAPAPSGSTNSGNQRPVRARHSSSWKDAGTGSSHS